MLSHLDDRVDTKERIVGSIEIKENRSSKNYTRTVWIGQIRYFEF